MEVSCCWSLSLVFVFLSVSASTSTLASDDIVGDRGSMGRSLLQAKQPCPVNFEFMNYTIITSRCKGPQYPPSLCCAAFKEFACPYAAELNDLSNDCAIIMFSYINLYGKYPPGLFANECHDVKEGLTCPATSPSQSAHVSGTAIWSPLSPLFELTTGFLVLRLRIS
ncbi:GPI-anchored protein LLG1-like isoform X2 [Actinidia eriantha]|uniref:GPI-anchored protein LLG1-like isoform X2 n=1 Tax=Actinidia eriantha TaxID=165200 RepID=UPI002588892D|nr:GPI-anchored protein LLG1-like isoform X2 [Actinidia eriantha]